MGPELEAIVQMVLTRFSRVEAPTKVPWSAKGFALERVNPKAKAQGPKGLTLLPNCSRLMLPLNRIISKTVGER